MVGAFFRYYAGWADKVQGKTIPAPFTGPEKFFAYTLREPLGVVGTILPWNAPSVLYAMHIAPSLACGNSNVVKPAETAPLSCLYMAELAAEAGIPEGVVNMVPGYGETAGQALCKHPLVRLVSFTGESITGKEVMTAAAQNLTPVMLELGGKSPVIIMPDADLDLAVGITQNGIFLNSGQICTAGSRIYCHESIYDEFVEKTLAATAKRRVGDNFTDVDQGPQQNEQQFAKVLKFLEKGKSEAKLLCGGNRIGDTGYFVEPTVFGNVTDEMDIARKEIFGPVMQILKFSNLDEVIERANDTTYGLAAGVITNNNSTINRVTRSLQAGTVWVNCWHKFLLTCPFGGYKQSGFGRTNGEDGMDSYTQTKTVVQAMENEGSWY
jgi:acyl-CoA reductase-like NAD-dependent aldehyde dehydrogenase